MSLGSSQRGQTSLQAAQAWDSARSTGTSDCGCRAGKHTGHRGSANISHSFPKSWMGFKSKYAGVGRKGAGA